MSEMEPIFVLDYTIKPYLHFDHVLISIFPQFEPLTGKKNNIGFKYIYNIAIYLIIEISHPECLSPESFASWTERNRLVKSGQSGALY